MHIFCPHCGKHIDVSTSEIEKLEGHYVCPQCLYDIELEGFEQEEPKVEPLDLDSGQPKTEKKPENIDSQNPAPSSTSPNPSPSGNTGTSTNTSTSTTSVTNPPTYNRPTAPQRPQPVDNVMRYCKYCGAFLRQGVNFCPKCGRYAKVMPPNYRPQQTGNNNRANQQQGYRQQQPPVDPRNRVRQPMASKTRTPGKSKVKPRDNKSWDSGIFSIMGCLTFTIIVVAIFFIIYIINGEGSLF